MNDIGWAVKQLWEGSRVCRAGWNGKGMWLILFTPDPEMTSENGFVIQTPAEQLDLEGVTALPWVGMKTADNKFVPWLCSQTDLLATDWEIAA